ncbi:TetR/AcrR family transcriptional regulator, partial [Psychrobacter sp. 1U2]
DGFGEDMDHQIVELVYKRLSERYEMPKFEDIQDILLVTYSIINGVFTLSYRRHERITDNYLQEATTASIAYLRCYLPEKLPRKNR